MVRHYIYISSTKVDMYLGQLAMQRKGRVEALLGFNLGVIGGKIGTTRESLSDPVERLKGAEAVVRSHYTVKQIGSSANWISDSATMACLEIAEHKGLMFYITEVDNHVFALGGSSSNMLGNIKATELTSSISHAPRLLSTLETVLLASNRKQHDASRSLLHHSLHVGISDTGVVRPWTKLIDEASQSLQHSPKQGLQFLARVLHTERWPLTGKRYTLATPLYVALADA